MRIDETDIVLLDEAIHFHNEAISNHRKAIKKYRGC